MLFKFHSSFFVGLGNQEGGEPGIADLDATQIQHGLQNGGILGVLVAHFAAGEASQRHFTDTLLEGVFTAQFGQIVIGPGDGGNAQFYFFTGKHLFALQN